MHGLKHFPFISHCPYFIKSFNILPELVAFVSLHYALLYFSELFFLEQLWSDLSPGQRVALCICCVPNCVEFIVACWPPELVWLWHLISIFLNEIDILPAPIRLSGHKGSLLYIWPRCSLYLLEWLSQIDSVPIHLRPSEYKLLHEHFSDLPQINDLVSAFF